MKYPIEKLINPRAIGIPEYDQIHVTRCWQNERLRRLMSNESSLAPLPRVQEAIHRFADRVNWYPEDPNYALKLRSSLAEYTGTQPENITLTNGSMELLDLLFQTFIARPGVDRIILLAPDYSAYINRAKFFGAVADQIVCGEEPEAAGEKIIQNITSQTKLILFSRPNNPVGTVLPKSDLVNILERGVITLVDEAYVELAEPGVSVESLLKDWDNLVILRTFSKGFGLAGMRLGYVLAHPSVIKYLNVVRHIFNVSLLAMVAGQAALDDLANAQRYMNEIRSCRDWTKEALSKIPGLRVIPSQGNFLLIDVKSTRRKAGEFVDFLFEAGFFVRDFSRKFGLEQDCCFRITIGKREDMEELVKSLRDFISNR